LEEVNLGADQGPLSKLRYNQIWMATKDAKKTELKTPIGNFYYTMMHFGLKNARAT